jgi:hypothetical protein
MADVIAHFVTGDYKRSGTYLEDDEYGRALDCFAKGDPGSRREVQFELMRTARCCPWL